MILWQLFWTFFGAGAFSFGGGFGMISVIRDHVLTRGWMTEDELLNIIAVAESTPGPIAAFARHLLKHPAVQAFLGGVRPCVVGMILAMSAILLLKQAVGMSSIYDLPAFDMWTPIILVLLFGIAFVHKRIRKKQPSPIVMILISAGLGILFYGL